MQVLITGANGFAGQHLSQHLATAWPDAQLHGTVLHSQEARSPHNHITLHAVDLTEAEKVNALIQDLQPAYIFHLAAQSSPRRSFADPWYTLKNNIQAQLNILEACRTTSTRILAVSSSEIYAASTHPLDEDSPFYPASPYAVSKITQDMLAQQYYLAYEMPVLRVRPFNHFGPGQATGFVAPDFAMQVARIEAGQQPPIMQVGNLSAQRDFADVRDVVRAYRLIMELGTPGDVYNVASGQAHSIQFLLDTLLALSTTRIEVQIDPARFMPVDSPIRQGDYSRLHRATGWQPEVPIEQSLQDLLDDCRQRVQIN